MCLFQQSSTCGSASLVRNLDALELIETANLYREMSLRKWSLVPTLFLPWTASVAIHHQPWGAITASLGGSGYGQVNPSYWVVAAQQERKQRESFTVNVA